MNEAKNVITQISNTQSFESVPDIFSKVKNNINPFTDTVLQLGDDINKGRTINNNEWKEICQFVHNLDYRSIGAKDGSLIEIFNSINIIDESRQKTTLEQTIADSYTKNCLACTGSFLAGLTLLSPIAYVTPIASTAIKTATIASACAAMYPVLQGVEYSFRAFELDKITEIETDISDLQEKWKNIKTREDVKQFHDKCFIMMLSIENSAKHISLSPTNAVKLLNCYYQLEQLRYHPIIPNTPSNNAYNEAQIKDNNNNNQINNNIINNSLQKDA